MFNIRGWRETKHKSIESVSEGIYIFNNADMSSVLKEVMSAVFYRAVLAHIKHNQEKAQKKQGSSSNHKGANHTSKYMTIILLIIKALITGLFKANDGRI